MVSPPQKGGGEKGAAAVCINEEGPPTSDSLREMLGGFIHPGDE